MAILTCTCFSTTLKQDVTFNAAGPHPEGNEQVTDQQTKSRADGDGFPVIYLLHGAYGSYASWGRFSNIERYAQQYGVVLIMASAEKQLLPGHGPRQPLLHLLHRGTAHPGPASVPRHPQAGEKTYVAGFSMGGYGAWFLALSRPTSTARRPPCRARWTLWPPTSRANRVSSTAPSPGKTSLPTPNIWRAARRTSLPVRSRPRQGLRAGLYHACGRSDFLYGMNKAVHERLVSMGADVPFVEGEGGHEWDYWDRTICEILPWLCED